MGVTRTNGIPGLPGNNNFKVIYTGAKRLGYQQVHTGHMAINSQPRADRPSCQQIGFCFQGCKSSAKWSTLYTEIPAAMATGKLELRPECQALQIQHDDAGKVTGVLYADKDGKQHVQKARVVCVAGNSIESPRLLLNSASAKFPDGLANCSGQVGRNYMRHMTGSVYAAFDQPVHMYRGTTMAGDHPGRGRATTRRAASSAATSWRPCRWACRSWRRSSIPAPGAASFTRKMEHLPQHGRHVARRRGHAAGDQPRHAARHARRTQYGLPIPNVHFDDHPNDIAMRSHAFRQGTRGLPGGRCPRRLRDPALSLAPTIWAPTG